MDDLVWLILSPGGGEPLAPCVGGKKVGGYNRRSLMLLLAPPPPLIDWCVEHPSLRPAKERGDTRRCIIVCLHGKHPRPQPRTNRNHHNHHYVTKHIWRLSLLTQMLLHLLCRSCSWCPERNTISKTPAHPHLHPHKRVMSTPLFPHVLLFASYILNFKEPRSGRSFKCVRGSVPLPVWRRCPLISPHQTFFESQRSTEMSPDPHPARSRTLWCLVM